MDERPHFLLRIYTDEAALDGDHRVYEIVLERAKELKMRGVTVLRALAGFGHTAHLHGRGFLDHNYPLIIHIVDTEGQVRGLANHLSDLHGIGLMTLEKVEILGNRQPE